MAQTNTFSSWWGRHALTPDRTDFWQVGPLKLWVHSSPHRLQFRWTTGSERPGTNAGDFLDGHIRSVPGSQDPSGSLIEAPANADSITCAYSGTGRGDLVLSPSLPDRAVVVRTRGTVGVLPGEDVTFYMIVPLSLRIELQGEPSKLLHEVPTYRLSDTWFGPMSNMGSLCFASASELYVDLRQVPLRPHCAITAITVRNLGTDTLKMERLSIPFARLSLFYSQRTGFWTDRLIYERRDDDEMAALKLDRQPPQEASPTQFVTGPRLAVGDSSSVVRAFSAIFGDRNQG